MDGPAPYAAGWIPADGWFMTARTTMAALALLSLTACAPPDEGGGEGEGSAQQPVHEATLVEFVTLDTTTFVEQIELVGETGPLREATVASELPGRIVELELVEGERVEQGDRVLRVDTATAQAQVDQLRAELRQVESDLDRARRLVERGLGTDATVEQLETQVVVLDESIRQVEISTRQARTSAPISGIVVETFAEQGEYTSPGVPIARIIDVDTIVVTVGLPERDISFVEEGMSVDVLIEATGEHHTGTLAEIGVEANRLNRTFPLEVHLDNADGRLRSGMRARVILEKQRYDSVVLIPRDTILQAIGGDEVFVLDGESAGTRSVTLGPGRGGYSVVTDGLAAGDRLVVRGHRSLVNSEEVRPIDVGACCAEQYDTFMNGSPADADQPR